jgi:hypothetical protein
LSAGLRTEKSIHFKTGHQFIVSLFNLNPIGNIIDIEEGDPVIIPVRLMLLK